MMDLVARKKVNPSISACSIDRVEDVTPLHAPRELCSDTSLPDRVEGNGKKFGRLEGDFATNGLLAVRRLVQPAASLAQTRRVVIPLAGATI